MDCGSWAFDERGPIFHFPKFAESKRDTPVESHFPSDVVKAVLEYVHLGDSDLLKVELDGKGSAWDNASANLHLEIQRVVQLSAAALYYDLPGLGRRAHSCVLRQLRQTPSLSFSILEACQAEGPDALDGMKSMALSAIESMDGIASLDPALVGLLSFETLQQIVAHKGTGIDDAMRFEIIRLWSVSGEERNSSASKLVEQHVRLEMLDPEMLSTSVESSGLATSSQLAKAFKSLALAAKKTYGVDFKKARLDQNRDSWKATSTRISLEGLDTGIGYVLSVPPMTTRNKIHKWTIKIEEAGEDSVLWLGVMTCGFESVSLNSYLAGHEFAHGLTSDKEMWSLGSSQRLFSTTRDCFKAGDMIDVELDLTERPHVGKFDLCFSRGSERILSIANSLRLLENNSMLPAVSVSKGSYATFRLISYNCNA
ncbi:expressed unknown protein [Seminavis robusta]|uniref:Uncharacterized protein n=1 Tax=Seminavis robusta TaxID=568900 RepID=A0A9N8HDU2_9STRA|nr:expressed unknown protein [Seminavis robusta]|eukprot:Sro272_g104960.1 n/a (426) ;mRNA; r:75086-76789